MKKMLILLLLVFGLAACSDSSNEPNNEPTTPVVEEPEYEVTSDGIEFSNGDSYKGEVQNDQMHGVGVLTLANGDSYEGQFVSGEFSGTGTYTYADGTYYIGEWENNLQEGFGEYFVDSREYYTGEWANGKMEGEGTYYYSPDEYIVGNFEDGHPVGECYEYFRFSKMFVGEYIDFDNTEFGYLVTIDGDLTRQKKVDGDWEEYIITPVDPTEDGVQFKANYYVQGLSYYAMADDNIDLYELPGSDVSYIKLDELLLLASPSLTTPAIEYMDGYLQVSVGMGLRDRVLYDVDHYLYQMYVDAEENTISYNNIDMMKIISNSSKSFADNSLSRLVSFTSENPHVERTIDLDDYNIDILVHDGQYLVPLYMADFLFPRSFMLYEMGDTVYVIDQESWKHDVFIAGMNELSGEPSDELIGLTKDYMKMLFDWEYGLENFNEIDEQARIDAFSEESITALHRDIGQFIYDLEDNHTNVINGGYLDYGYRGISRYYEDFMNDYIEYVIEPTATVYGDVTVIQFDSFDSVQIYKVIELIEESTTDQIAFDIRANGGGALGSSVHLLNYISEDPVFFNIYNTLTEAEEWHEYTLIKGDPVRGKEYSLFISNHTYSAANFFASAFKDNELGTIVGTDSLGGACVVQFASLPSGMIIRTSSTDALFNVNSEIVEDGITPHIYVDAPEGDMTYVETLVSKIS